LYSKAKPGKETLETTQLLMGAGPLALAKIRAVNRTNSMVGLGRLHRAPVTGLFGGGPFEVRKPSFDGPHWERPNIGF